MELEALQTFIAVVRRGSFASAARDRGVSPSSVSRAIGNLEDELGMRLFQRTTRRLTTTDAGRLYYDRVTPLVEELQAAGLQARDASSSPTGTLRVTAPVSFAQLNLVPLLPEFTDLFPDLNVELQLTDTRVDLLDANVDLAVRLGRLDDTALVHRKLCKVEYVLVAAPGYLAGRSAPRSPFEIEAHRCLVFPLSTTETRWRFRDPSGTELTVAPRPHLAITNALALRDAAVAGLGLLMTARWVVGAELANGSLVQVLPDWKMASTHFGVGASILLPSRAYVPLKARAFVEFCVPRFAGGPPSACLAG